MLLLQKSGCSCLNWYQDFFFLSSFIGLHLSPHYNLTIRKLDYMVSHMTPRRLPPLICVLQEKTVNKRAGRGDFLWTELSLKWSCTVL